jgi:hypothetical protein
MSLAEERCGAPVNSVFGISGIESASKGSKIVQEDGILSSFASWLNLEDSSKSDFFNAVFSRSLFVSREWIQCVYPCFIDLYVSGLLLTEITVEG